MTASGEAEIIPAEAGKGKRLNARVRQLLKELQTSLSRALGDSAQVNDVLQRIRKEGWSLYLVIDRKSDEAVQEALELTTTSDAAGGEPMFRIDGRDLLFLKSVGIDPTRKLRRRREH